MRQAIASGQSEFVEKTLTPDNPFALKKQTDVKRTTTTHLRSKDISSTGSSPASTLKHKDAASKGTASESTDSNGVPRPSGDANAASANSKKTKSSSLLYSMLSSKTLSPPQTRAHYNSPSPTNSVHVDDAVSPAICVSPESSTLSSPRRIGSSQSLQSMESEDGHIPDSTTRSSDSSPYNNPSSVHPDVRTSQASTACMTSLSDRTMSSSDLGYHSESNNSLRDRVASSFTGYESETSCYLYESGTDTSPPNPYSPDYPLSVLSSDGSHVSLLTASPSNSHSSSLFQNPPSIHSVLGEPADSPTYFLPLDEQDFSCVYAQHSPGNLSASGESGVPPQSTVRVHQQWSPGSSVSSPPEQYTNGHVDVPVSDDDAFARGSPHGFSGGRGSVPPQGFSGGMNGVLPQGFSGGMNRVPPQGFFSRDRTEPTRNLPPVRFQYTSGASSSQQFVGSQPRVAQPVSSSSSLLFSDVFVTSVSGECVWCAYASYVVVRGLI